MTPVEAHALKIETQEKRKALQAKLPHLAQRVFDLSGKHYSGSGYHWSLVKSIGYLLHKVNDFDSKYTHEDHMTIEVLYEDLLDRVRQAEASSWIHEDHQECVRLGERLDRAPDASDLALFVFMREGIYDSEKNPSEYREIRAVLRELCAGVLLKAGFCSCGTKITAKRCPSCSLIHKV